MEPVPKEEWFVSELKWTHHRLDQLLRKHQTAVRNRRIKDALVSFETLAGSTGRHMSEEEKYLLPYIKEDEVVHSDMGFEVFLEEHRRIRGSFIRLSSVILDWGTWKGSSRTERWMLEEEFTLVQLLNNHELREEKYLFPKLDRIMDGVERNAIRKRMKASWTGTEDRVSRLARSRVGLAGGVRA